MTHRIGRFLIALLFAALTAGVSLVAANAQQGATVQPQTQDPSNCVACHTEFQSSWQNGPHGQAGTDPVFQQQWTDQGKPGACLVCHTTGYDPASGTWQSDNVSCIACHGPAAPDHPKSPMPVDRSSDLCARCHSSSRFDWQDWQVSTHYQRGMSCITCHDPHSASLKVTKAMDGSAQYNDASQLCVTCHKDVSMNFPYSVHQKQGVTCIDCHVTHTEINSADAHTLPDHSFKANIDSCNKCHSDQMHMPINSSAAIAPVNSSSTASQPTLNLQTASVTPEPSPVSPFGYAVLAALIGLAAGMILAPWLERWFRTLSKHPEETHHD